MSDDLITWLRAQLDAEEADARYNEDMSVDAGWAPRRVLAEVDAKRRILDWHSTHKEGFFAGIHCEQCEDTAPCMTVRLLVLPYADRPGYRDEWKP